MARRMAPQIWILIGRVEDVVAAQPRGPITG
jgi:hypothetical protein